MLHRVNWQTTLQAAFGFALTIMFWPGQAGAAEPSRWAFLAVSVPLGLFAIRIKPNTIIWLLTALLGWAALTMLWADVWYDAANGWFELALLCGLIALSREAESIDWFYKGLVAGIAAQLPIIVLQAFHYYPVIAVMPDGTALPSGLFVNPSMLGEACAPIAVVMMVKKRWFWAAPVVAALLLSQNRSGFISFGLCLLLWALWENRRTIWLCLLPAVPVAYLVLIKGVDPLSSFWQRLDIWKGVVSGLTVFGHGIGQFYAVFPLYNDAIANEPSPTWIMTAHAHNDILEYAFELGLPGIIILCCISATIVWKARSAERYGLLAVAVTALVGFPLHMPFTGAVAAVMAGYASRDWGMVRRDLVHSRPLFYPRRQFVNAVEPAESLPTIPV